MSVKEIALGLLAGIAINATAQAADIDHVLLISVDGLHALDVTRYVEGHPNSALAELSRHGVTYSNARTPANSDSFPGLLALVTGGSPISHGLFYDVSYDRTLFDPTNVSCSGGPGNMMVFDESIDRYSSGNVSLNIIDPSKLPRGRNEFGHCVPVYPHDAIKTNTIFEVVRAKGGRTAWADKHPAYDLVNGPSGKGVEDLYTPEITNVGGFDATVLAYGLQKTDEALGSMIQALKQRGLYNSTLFIVGAKHGQSPINPAKVNKPGHFADLVAALPDAATNPGALAIASASACAKGPCGFVQDDDIALIWLQDQNQTKAVVDYLNTNAKALFIDEVLGGDELKLRFNDPAHESRTPDIIVQPIYGTIYTGSKTKNAEHGGFSFGDTNVGLIVSNPRLPGVVLKTPVVTSQVAPTILHALDIEPGALNSVRVEHTSMLPGLWNDD